MQPAPEEVAAPAPDLMSALKASLDAVRAREGDAAAKRRKPAAEKAAAKKAAARKPGLRGRPRSGRRSFRQVPARRASKQGDDDDRDARPTRLERYRSKRDFAVTPEPAAAAGCARAPRRAS